MIYLTLLFASAAIISFFITFPVVRILEILRLTQYIREEGPASHQVKAGTVTMGGIGFVLAIIAMGLIAIDYELNMSYLALILLIASFALIGFADDFIKTFLKRNLGLTFRQKILFQTLCAAVFSGFIVYTGHHSSTGEALAFLGFSHPVLYFFLSLLIVVGTANAANLTDGLNGLLAGSAVIAFASFAFLASRVDPSGSAAAFSLICAGSILAFLYFNFPGARAFMGDVGSLPIGAALAGLAIITHTELWLLIIGGIFLMEALSVILQVSAYKLFNKRILKMAPLHHHFELLGFSETKVVIGFWIVGLVLGVIGIVI